jgi:hypothetical protein
LLNFRELRKHEVRRIYLMRTSSPELPLIGLLGSSYTRSCITPPVSGRRIAHSPARIPMKLLEGMGVPRGIMC